MSKRKQHAPEFKAKVALEALKVKWARHVPRLRPLEHFR